jgi:hypothetical protein
VGLRRRQLRGLAALLVVGVLLAACGSETPDIDPDLEEIDSLEPDPDPEPEPEPDPEPDPDPDAHGPEDEPADEGEGDAAGGVIPESAFEINEDLDADEDAQRRLLRTHAAAVRLINAALAGEDVSEDALAEVLSPSELRGVLGSIADQEERGEVQLLPDSTTRFVRIERIDGAGAQILQCIEHGPGSGVFDRDTGEQILEMPPTELFVDELAMLVEDEQVRWVIDGGSVSEDARCA